MSSLGDAVGALLGRRVKERFEREGIPFPRRVVYLHTKTP
jgi:hypothetical protein